MRECLLEKQNSLNLIKNLYCLARRLRIYIGDFGKIREYKIKIKSSLKFHEVPN